MATGNAKRFAELGTAVPAAKELARQITAGAASVPKLIESGWAPPLAVQMAASITALTVTTVRRNALANLGMPGPMIRELGTQVAS